MSSIPKLAVSMTILATGLPRWVQRLNQFEAGVASSDEVWPSQPVEPFRSEAAGLVFASSLGELNIFSCPWRL